MILTNYFIKQKIRSLAVNGTGRNRYFRDLEDANAILVIYNEKDRAVVETCIERFRTMHKQVRTLVCGVSVPGENEGQNLSLCTKTDLNCWGFPKDTVCKTFNAIQADILIDLSHPHDYAARYLMLSHPCGFKIGMKCDGMDLYDLAISVTDGENIKQLFGHILFYLQSIRTK